MVIVFESHRLVFRLFTADDAQLVLDLNKDAQVVQFTHDHIKDLNHAATVLQQSILPQYALYNYGRWAVHLKEGLEFIGWCGLKYRSERDETDVGYRFKVSSWGKGYATEAAFATITFGFEKLGLTRIMGHAEPGNHASIRVLEKCGMSYVGEEIIDGHSAKTYQLLNPLIH